MADDITPTPTPAPVDPAPAPAPASAPEPDEPIKVKSPFVAFEQATSLGMLTGRLVYISADAVMAIRDDGVTRTISFGGSGDYVCVTLTPQEILQALYTDGVEIDAK